MEILISGASTGIGRATAVHLARLGHGVWAGVRGAKAAGEIEKLNVRGLRPVQLDVTEEASIRAAVGEIRKRAGTLHALVNNAGIVVAGPVEAVKPEDWRRQFDVNLFGAIRLTQECLPLLREAKGRIVNVSSIAGRLASPFLAPYSASKFALEAVSDSLRRELAPHGVRVAVIEPGPIDTPIWPKAVQDGLNRRREYDTEIESVYGHNLKKFQERVATAENRASPVRVVVEAIEHALTARHPKTRYPVGRGIALLAITAQTLPDAWLDRMI